LVKLALVRSRRLLFLFGTPQSVNRLVVWVAGHRAGALYLAECSQLNIAVLENSGQPGGTTTRTLSSPTSNASPSDSWW